MNIFNKYGFIPDIEGIYDYINKASKTSFKRSNLKNLINKIDEHYPLSDKDLIDLYFIPQEYRPVIIEKAISLNEFLYKRRMKFYGVIYVNDFCIETCSYCGDNIYSERDKGANVKHLLTNQAIIDDVQALLFKNPNIPEICILSGDTPSLNTKKWIDYIEACCSVYTGKIILNIQPQDINFFRQIKNKFSHRQLQFRVFQETYDYNVYSLEHPHYSVNNYKNKLKDTIQSKMGILYPPKMNYSNRINSQERAVLAGFEEYGFGVLFGLNENQHGGLFEIIAMYHHSYYLHNKYGLWPSTISFPRILPSLGIDYEVPGIINDEDFLYLIALFRLGIPYTHLIITCRETAEFRRKVRPLINIEDFEARPGPGGNRNPSVAMQMEITDRRPGQEIKMEIINDGFVIN